MVPQCFQGLLVTEKAALSPDRYANRIGTAPRPMAPVASSATDTSTVLYETTAFNQDLSTCCEQSHNMEGMFAYAKAFGGG